MTAPIARIVLVTRRLRWSSPILFNDPFDVPINLELPFKPAALQLAVAKRLADMVEAETPFRHPILASLAAKMTGNVRKDIRREVAEALRQWPVEGIELPTTEGIQAFWEKLRPDMRILCVSERNDVTPMWANYADNYSGVVLEFMYRDYIDTPLALARPVTYRDAPPRLATMEQWVESIFHEKPFDPTEFFTDYQYVKGSHWGHEFEWRVVTYKGAGESGLSSDWGFSPAELSAVYLGSRMTGETGRELIALLKYGLEHVRVFKAVENQRELKITFEPVAQ